MRGLFLNIVNMSLSASWLIAAVLIVRIFLKRAPRWIPVLLWGIVALRLLCPFPIESAFSLVPESRVIPDTVLSDPGFAGQGAFTPADTAEDAPQTASRGERDAANPAFPQAADHRPDVVELLAGVWLTGAILLISYSVWGCRRLRRQVRTAVLLRGNIFQSEHIHSAFVLGIILPKIYVPFQVDRRNLEYVILHEQAHIRRMDHLWKTLGFLLLAVYWFHPLLWISYALLCRDIELACDEKVVGELSREQRADYSQALLACSVRHRSIAACPLAFGEVGVKERVKSVLHYKKPAFWVGAAAVVVCLAVAVCFLTDPVQPVEASRQGGEDMTQPEDMMRPEDMTQPEDVTRPEEPDPSADDDGTAKDKGALWDTVIWEAADLDHDGEAESIRVRETAAGELYELEVVTKDGAVLWSREAGLPHVGWTSVLLYRRGDKDYLIEYLPAMNQGFGSYTCRMFSLEGGQETEEDYRSLDFALPAWLITGKMRGFAENVNGWLGESTVLLSTLEGVLVIGPVAAVEVPEIYPVVFDRGGADHEEGHMDAAGQGLPREALPLTFMLASGAGGWGTTLTLQPDGSFKGEYEDFNAEGSSHICRFSGQFGEIVRTSEFACTMRLESLKYEREPGEKLSGGYIASEAYGLESGETYVFYMPGTPVEGLDEAFLNWWPDRILGKAGTLRTLSSYALYNVDAGYGFFTSHLQ